MRNAKWLIATAILAVLAMPATAYADGPQEPQGTRRHAVIAPEGQRTEETAETPQEGLEAPDLRFSGVVEDNGRVFTWYSQNVLPGEGLAELNANGRHVGEGGYVMDADGYIAVASPWGQDQIGTVVETPWGLAKVYDACEGDSYDVYTGW